MIHEVYIVDIVKISTEDVLCSDVNLLRGYIRGFSLNRYVALHYRDFMQSILKDLCVLDVFQYNVTASQNISNLDLAQYANLLHTTSLNQSRTSNTSYSLEYTRYTSIELTEIEEYETQLGGVWYSPESLVEYCMTRLLDESKFFDTVFVEFCMLSKYLSDDVQCWYDVITDRFVTNLTDTVSSYNLKTTIGHYNILPMAFDTTGICYWLITTRKFLTY